MPQQPQHTNDEILNLALEVAQLGFWDHNMVTDELYRSPEWGAMLGYSPKEVESDLNFWLNHVHPDDMAKVNKAVEAHEVEGQKNFEVEHRMRTSDGQWKWILNWGRIISRNEEGKPLRALGFHLDITQRKNVESAIAQADKLSTIGTLAGGLAHDFNNLLTIIRGNLELAQMTADVEESNTHLNKAQKALKRSQELTDRLLTFSRGGTPSLEPVNIELCILEARDLVLSGSNCNLIIDCQADLPLVAACSGQLAQVFQNLLLNAMQAMPEGGHIHVCCRSHEHNATLNPILPSGSYVRVNVTDQGPGIKPALAKKIFDPFFTTRSEGKGLGLATAHSIINDHGGSLELLSEVGTGANFCIQLPVARNLRGVTKYPEESESKLCRRRLLIMDDEEMILDMAESVAKTMGVETLCAAEGDTAVEIYRQAIEDGHPIDVVIMDLTIPGGMGGKEAITHILRLDAEAKVVVSSGYSDDPVMAQYKDHGFQACLKKPYELREFMDVLEGLLD